MNPPPHKQKPIKKKFFKYFYRSSRSWKKKFQDHTGKKRSVLQLVWLLQGSVITSVIPWILFFTAYGFLIYLLKYYQIFSFSTQATDIVQNIVLSFNLILSLLLIFRTNSANERYWEGRKLWGALVNTVRNLTRNISVTIETKQESEQLEKEITQKLVIAFAVAMKLHLRQEKVDDEVEKLMSKASYLKLKTVAHPPLEISLWIGEYLQKCYYNNLVNVYQLNALHKLVDELINILGGCERILKTPTPLTYSMFLRQLLIVYCLLLPIELVVYIDWLAAPFMAFFSLFFFGIEEICSELENPFGHDPNDLPLDHICNTISDNIEDLIAKHVNIHDNY